jgi:enterochelin esterase-like enzyme
MGGPAKFSSPIASRESSVVGDVRVHNFPGKIFRNTRTLRVWLPSDYERNAARYPVFYLNDGQNLFDPATAFTGIDWQADETGARLIRERKIRPLIIVGIDNAGADRIKEYVPYRSLHPPVLRPLGRKYPAFLMGEVMPFIEQRYRVGRGPDETGLGGSSLGGLVSLYTAAAFPHVFGRVLAESPSLDVSNRQLLRESRRVREWPARIFLGVGTRETGREEKDREIVQDVREFERILVRAGLGAERLRLRVEEGAGHSEEAWARRLPEALTFLFGA